MTATRRVERATTLRGSLRVPGDKSTSHRALMLSALASGESTIEGLSPGQDVKSTSRIMQQLGARRSDDGTLVSIIGPEDGLRGSEEELDCGNSGTTMRLLCGVVSTLEGTHRLIGDASLSKRPMDRVATPLTLMGAIFRGEGDRLTAPIEVIGSSELRGIDYRVPTPSAQVKSAILFAGLRASGDTIVREAVRTRSTTEDMMRAAGIPLSSTNQDLGRVVVLSGARPRAHNWRVPGDPSQAAFFCVLGSIHDDARIEILDVDTAPERTGFVTVLQRMGAALRSDTREGRSVLSVESSELTSSEIHSSEIPSVDEVPVLAVAAAAARGVTAFRDMGELRIKESDRFKGSMTLASLLGCRVWSEGDDFFVEGLASARAFSSFSVDAGLDHRIVMSAAVAGMAGSGCSILGAETVASSYPRFFEDAASLI
ncbi:MAG: 3-phosphoshikimate 1-carboxyvinyltransferase [Acidimicrobiales bacterium]